MTHTHRAGAAAVLAAALIALTSGCAGGEPAAPPSSTPPPPSTVPSTSATPTTTAPPTSAPPPAPVPLSGAADGSNLRACRDGHCQVVVQRGTVLSLSPGLRITQLSITEVTADSVRFKILAPGDNTFDVAGGVGWQLTVQGVLVSVDGISGNRAVVSVQAG